MAGFFAFFVVLFLCFILDLIFFPVISSFQDVSVWKLWKMSRILWQVQKLNSFYDDVMQVLSLAPPFFFSLYFPSLRSCEPSFYPCP